MMDRTERAQRQQLAQMGLAGSGLGAGQGPLPRLYSAPLTPPQLGLPLPLAPGPLPLPAAPTTCLQLHQQHNCQQPLFRPLYGQQQSSYQTASFCGRPQRQPEPLMVFSAPTASRSHLLFQADKCSLPLHFATPPQASEVPRGPSEPAPSRGSARRVPEPAGAGKFGAYLGQLVVASNVPLAYAILLVAFLTTVVAAASMIALLTLALTLTGYTAHPITEGTFGGSLAVGVVCASLALALVAASLLVWRRHCQAAYYYLDEPPDASRATSSPQLSETYDDTEYGSTGVGEWARHVQRLHADGDIGFAREFEQIQQANQQSAALTCEHSQLPENKHKNRYINIVAYDHSRVVLRAPLGGQKKLGHDYINANFIDVSTNQARAPALDPPPPGPRLTTCYILIADEHPQGYNKPRAYIGTQGPLVSTFEDHWRMIWEQRVVIIVMITNLQERGRVR